jgi:mannose/cellobiose epimerase-like protein (N-acyl-D-glucosamine 2-epimerase family)
MKLHSGLHHGLIAKPIRCRTWMTVSGILLFWLLPSLALFAQAKDRQDYARDFRRQLIEQVLPYWYETGVDRVHGGYVLADDAARKVEPAREKQLVSQCRMLWGFSHAHLKHLEDGQRDYLAAARQGYNFLIQHFLDNQHGGYFWKTGLAGNVIDSRKYLYGEAFVIYSFVEYYRASGDRQALDHALNLYKTVQAKLYDRRKGGWFEHAERDFTLILGPQSRDIEVEVAGRKSANAHLHWMEALTELYDASHDSAVKKSLKEALRLNAKYFYPLEPGKSCFHRMPDWKRVPNDPNPELSYGHNVEFAWLMIRAQQVLKQPQMWTHFDRIMDHALRYGYDHVNGGLYHQGLDNKPATDTDKIWWVQAEMLAALTDGLKHQYDIGYSLSLDKLLVWLEKYMIRPADGIWIASTDVQGNPKDTSKAHNWKANYHDVRAMVKFMDAFTPPPTK